MKQKRTQIYVQKSFDLHAKDICVIFQEFQVTGLAEYLAFEWRNLASQFACDNEIHCSLKGLQWTMDFIVAIDLASQVSLFRAKYSAKIDGLYDGVRDTRWETNDRCSPISR